MLPLTKTSNNLMKMPSLASKKLLVLAPHFKVFIKDPTILLSHSFANVTVLVPIPRFSKIALSLPRIGHHFDFIRQAVTSNAENGSCNLLFSKFSTLPIEAMRKRNYFLFARSCSKTLASRDVDFDLIHAHFIEFGYAGIVLKEAWDKPLILSAHGSDVYDSPFRNSWYNALAKYVLREADRVITVSQFNAEKLFSLGVPSNKLHVIPNGYDEKLFKLIPSCAMRRKLGLPLNKRILLSVGNLIDIKGHTYLLDAMNLVLKKRADVMLVIVGSGSLRLRLQKKLNGLGLNGKILLAGSRIHEEIPMWMNASDIFVLPSLGEGFPTVIPEAMACGKPVIGTRVGGVPEVLSNQDVGLIVNPRDPVALADAILEALDKKWQTEFITNYARQYSLGILVKQILMVYQSLLNM